MREGIIEFVDMLDKLLRLAPNAMLPDETARAFVDAVVEAVAELAAIPAIRRLMGRVREASPDEIKAAAQALIDVSGQDKGFEVVEKMSTAAADANRTKLASTLSEMQKMMGASRNGTS